MWTQRLRLASREMYGRQVSPLEGSPLEGGGLYSKNLARESLVLSSSKPRTIILYTIQVVLTTTMKTKKHLMMEIAVVVVGLDCLASFSNLIMVIMMGRMMELMLSILCHISCLTTVLLIIHWRNNRMVVRYHNRRFVLPIVSRRNNYTKRRNRNLLLILTYQLVYHISPARQHVISSQPIYHKWTLANSTICKGIDATTPSNNSRHCRYRCHPGVPWML